MRMRARDLVFFLFHLTGVLSNIEYLELVMPRYAVKDGDVFLKCNHNVPPEQVHKVEWRKDNFKIFQYIKGRKPPFRYFNVSGAELNWKNSSEKQVHLTNLQFPASGFYTCIVSMETPIFSKDSESKELTVIERQERDPIISFEKETYQFGEILKANCTTDAARPPPHITWFINGYKVVDRQTKSFSNGNKHGHGYFDQKARSIKQLSIEVSELHVGDDGVLRLTCISTIPGYVTPGEEYADKRTKSVTIDIRMSERPEEPIANNKVTTSKG